MENLRNHQHNNYFQSSKINATNRSTPFLKGFIIFHENLVAVERSKVNLLLNRLLSLDDKLILLFTDTLLLPAVLKPKLYFATSTLKRESLILVHSYLKVGIVT